MQLEFFLEDKERIKLAILRYIELKDRSIEVRELASFIEVTETRLKKFIDELNNELYQFESNAHIHSDGVIVHPINIDYSIVKKFRLSYYKEAPTFLLFKAFIEENMTVKEFSIRHYFALPTVYLRQRTIKKFLSKHNLEIKNGKVVGNETIIRNLIFSVFFDIYNGIELPFTEEIRNQIKSLSEYLTFLFHLRLSKTEQVKLNLLIGILICREKNGFSLSKEEDFFIFLTSSDIQLVIDKIADFLSIEDETKKCIEIRYLLGFLKSLGVDEVPVVIQASKFEDIDEISINLASKITSELKINEHKNRISFENKLIALNRYRQIFDFTLSSFASSNQRDYFLESYPKLSKAVTRALTICKEQLHFSDETIVNQLFFEYVFLLINHFAFIEIPVYVCVDFSLGNLYTNFIQNQIQGFKNLNIIVENRLTSKTDIFVSDSVIENLSITQIIWKRPPTPNDWEVFGDAIIDVKRQREKDVN